MENIGFALGTLGLLVGGLITWLALRVGGAFRELGRRSTDLERRVDELEDDAERRRHTHRTIAGLEDALAVLIDTEIEAEAFQARLGTIHRILGKTREGPESYSNSEWDGNREGAKNAKKDERR
jgi:hypothetical protein